MASISMDRGGSDSKHGELDDSSLSFCQYIPDKKRKRFASIRQSNEKTKLTIVGHPEPEKKLCWHF